MVGVGCLAAPASAQDETKIYVTPRLWYSFISTGERTVGGASVEHTTVPLFGGSVSIVPANMGGTTFSLTGFFGTGNGDYDEFNFIGDNHLKRLDVEGVVQIPIWTGGAHWWLGLRYVHAESEQTGVDAFARPFKFTTNGNYYLGEIGLGASTPLNAAGTHRLFGALTFLAGQRENDARDICCVVVNDAFSSRDTVAGIDTNFGYSVALGPSATFYARYRLFVLSEVKNFSSPDSLTIVHGPEVNLSLKLN